MNKLISFRELIDLEPKPKKVKFRGRDYEWNGAEYNCYNIVPVFDEGVIMTQEVVDLFYCFKMNNMKEPNIEIIEEDVVIEKLPIEYDENTKELLLRDRYYQIITKEDYIEYLVIKINEIIDLLNKKEGK